MKTNTPTPTQYRVTAPMIQIPPVAAISGRRGGTPTHYRDGDILPDWVPTDSIERLLSIGAIEAV